MSSEHHASSVAVRRRGGLLFVSVRSSEDRRLFGPFLSIEKANGVAETESFRLNLNGIYEELAEAEE